MDGEQYLKERLQAQIAWYDRRSAQSKWLHVGTRGVEIVFAAIIPLLAGFVGGTHLELAVVMGILGALVAIAGGFSTLLKFEENWIKYRTTAESLKKENYLFQTGVQPYDTDDPLSVLVQRVETLVSQENTNWAQRLIPLLPPRSASCRLRV